MSLLLGVHQAGNLNFPLRYPASVIWEGSENVFVGTGDELERAKNTNKYVAVFNPATSELTAMSSGEISLKVISNNVEAVGEVIIQ